MTYICNDSGVTCLVFVSNRLYAINYEKLRKYLQARKYTSLGISASGHDTIGALPRVLLRGYPHLEECVVACTVRREKDDNKKKWREIRGERGRSEKAKEKDTYIHIHTTHTTHAYTHAQIQQYSTWVESGHHNIYCFRRN